MTTTATPQEVTPLSQEESRKLSSDSHQPPSIEPSQEPSQSEAKTPSWASVIPLDLSRNQLGQLLLTTEEREKERRSEFSVSREIVESSKLALVRALFLHTGEQVTGEQATQPNDIIDKMNKVAGVILNDYFLKLEGISIEQIPKDFSEERLRFFQDLVERFYQRYPDSVIVLGGYVIGNEWELVKKICKFEITSKRGEEFQPPAQFPDSDKIRKLRIYSDGKIEILSRKAIESYEEYCEEIERINREKGWLGRLWSGRRPLSRDQFESISKGREGEYTIHFSPLNQKLTEEEKLYLQKLGILSSTSSLTPEQIEGIYSIMNTTLVFFNELMTATGVSAQKRFEKLKALFSNDSAFLEILGLNDQNSILDRIREEISQKTQKELEEKKQVWQRPAEEAMRVRLKKEEERLRKELGELRKKEDQGEQEGGNKQKEDSRLEEELKRFEELLREIIEVINEQENDQKKQKDNGEGRDLQSIDHESVIEILQRLIEDTEVEIVGWGDITELKNYRDFLLERILQMGRIETVTDADGNKKEVSYNGTVIDILNAQLNDVNIKISKFKTLLRKKRKLETALNRLKRFLDKEISIDGETKKLKEWLRVKRLESSESRETQSIVEDQEQVESKEKELAEIVVVLDYFEEEKLAQRKLREREVEIRFLEDKVNESIEIVVSLNPELRSIFYSNGDIKDNAGSILKTLYIIFGEEFLFPKDPNDEKVRLITKFIIQNQNSFTDIIGFDQLIGKIRLELLSGQRGKTSNKSNNNQSQEPIEDYQI